MTTKKQRTIRFIKRLVFKIFTFAIILGIISYLINFPGFTNDMAMAQFENDNYAFATWDGFVHIRNLFNSYYDLAICFFVGTVIYDIVEFIKINKGENTHEN